MSDDPIPLPLYSPRTSTCHIFSLPSSVHVSMPTIAPHTIAAMIPDFVHLLSVLCSSASREKYGLPGNDSPTVSKSGE